MTGGWRLYGAMIALAAITGTVVALALSGGPRLPTESGRGATAGASAAGRSSASPGRSTAASPSPSTSRSPAATPGDPLRAVRPQVFAWRPDGTTAIVEKLISSGTEIVAVPVNGGAATPLVDLPPFTSWHIRTDGSALALALRIGGESSSRSRIAALSFSTGAISWVTPDESGVSQISPRWSNDGTVIYYTRAVAGGETSDLGVYRIRPDGSNLTQLRPPTARAAAPLGLTPDGLGLVLSQAQADGTLDILDLQSRVTRTYSAEGGGAFVESWRPQRPRALVSVGGPAVGPTQLVLWDDLGPTVVRQLVSQSLIRGADWDPTANRLVVAMNVATAGSVSGTTDSMLVTMDATGQSRSTVAGTEGAASPYWLRAGIAYLWSDAAAPRASELRIAQPTGSAVPRTLYRDTDLIRLFYVSP